MNRRSFLQTTAAALAISPRVSAQTIPSWPTELRELAPGVFAYTQASGPGVDNASLDVQLISLGAAHTWADVAVYLPQRRILFSGDIALYYVTPPAHNGQITTWIKAIDRVLAMDVDVIVPGHGPVGTKKELAETRAYLDLMVREARPRYEAKMSPGRAAADIDVGRFAAWTNPERTAWNMVRLYAELAVV